MKRSLLGALVLLLTSMMFAQPANDECADATFVPVAGPGVCIPITGSNVDATDSGVAHSCAFYQGGDVWFTVTVPPTGIVVLDVRPTEDTEIGDMGMEVYSGDCGSLTSLECDDDDGDGLFPFIQLEGLTPGEVLSIAVWEYGNNAFGDFELCAYQPPTCPEIEEFGFSVESNCDGDSITVEWGSLNPGATYIIEYGPTGFTPGTGMTVTGPVLEGDNSASISGLTPLTTYDVYFVEECDVDDQNESILTTITTIGPIANATCAEAIDLTVGAPETCTPTVGTIACNDGADMEPAPTCASYQGGEVWYSFTAPGPAVIVETSGIDGSFTDGGLALFEGSCGNLTQIGCNDDGGEGAFSIIETADLTAGETYYIAVWEFGGNAVGDFNICVYLPPVCPDIDPTTFGQDGCSDTSFGVTWETTAIGSTYTIEYGAPDFIPGEGTVVTGTVDSGTPSVDITDLMAGTEYEVYLFQNCGGISTDTISGLFTTGSAPLSNDDCIDAQVLPVAGPDVCIPFLATTECASGSDIEPGCAFYQGGEVWFAITAPPTGAFIVETAAADSGFADSGMALFSGTCGDLTLIECNDDGGDEFFSLIEVFDLNPGEVYYVAVWEYGGDAPGAFNICAYSPPTCPIVEVFDLNIDSASTTSLVLNWPSLNDGVGFEVEIGEAGFIPGQGTLFTGVVGVDGPPVTLDGLIPESEYDIYVQEICGVGDSSQVVGPFSVATSPANDNLCDAVELTMNAPAVMMTNSGATGQIDEANIQPSCWLLETETESVWASFEATADGPITVTTDFEANELHDTHIAVYTLDGDCSDMNNLTEVGCDEDGGEAAPNGWTSVVTMDSLIAGQTYYVLIDGYAAADGDFFIQVFDGLVSVDDVAGFAFNLFPNPTEGDIILESEESGHALIQIVNIQGQVLSAERSFLMAGQQMELDMSNMADGIYFVEVIVDEVRSVKRIMKY